MIKLLLCTPILPLFLLRRELVDVCCFVQLICTVHTKWSLHISVLSRQHIAPMELQFGQVRRSSPLHTDDEQNSEIVYGSYQQQILYHRRTDHTTRISTGSVCRQWE